jgi:signal peptidase II
LRVIFISLFILIADQVSKIYVKGFYLPLFDIEHSGLQQSRSIPVIDRLFYITPVENSGIAFGIDFGPEFKTILSIITIVATLGLLIYFIMVRKETLFLRLSVAVVLGGAFGNLIDRIFYGYFYGYGSILSGNVVDFIDLRLFSFFLLNKTFGIYVFNIADIAIIFGVAAMLIAITRKRREAYRDNIVGIENTLSLD